ncbi:MAG: VCBS repeat-containing protein, partial [Nitrospirota bacterium]
MTLPSLSHSALITFTYHGTITTSSAYDGAKQEAFDAFVGKPVQFSVTFESDPLLNPDTDSRSTRGTYQLQSLTATLMGNNWTVRRGSISVLDNHRDFNEDPVDYFVAGSPDCSWTEACSTRFISGPEIGGLPLASVNFGFSDSILAALSSDALPLAQPDPAHFSVPPDTGSNSFFQLVFFDEPSGTTAPFPTGQIVAEFNIKMGPSPPEFFEYEVWMQPQTSLALGPFAIEGKIVNSGTLPIRLSPHSSSIGSWPVDPGFVVTCDLPCSLDQLGDDAILEPGESVSFNWLSGNITRNMDFFAGIFFEAFICLLPADLGWNCNGTAPTSHLLVQSQWVAGPADSNIPFSKKVYNLGTLGSKMNFPYKPTTPDLNDDGKADLLWRDMSTGIVAGWLMNGTTINERRFLGGIPGEWKMEALGDVDGDGQTDVIWKHAYTHVVAVWLMNGLSIKSVNYLGGVLPEWDIAGMGDLSGDRKADLVWRNGQTGQVTVWLMNGEKNAFSAFLIGVSLDWEIAGIGDVDGDSKDDLIWHNSNTESVAIWFMNGFTVKSVEFPGQIFQPTEQHIKGVKDMNGDGKADIIWQNAVSQNVAVWLMNGSSILSTVNLGGVPPEWKMVQLSDMNGDG